MFDRPRYYERDVLPLAQRIAKRERKYQRQLKELDNAINLQQKKLGEWLINWENKKTLHYKLVEDIHSYFYQEDNEKNNQPLNFRENRLSDLLAVNNAIYKKDVSDLGARSKASMDDKNIGSQVVGILMGCLAVALTVTGFSTFYPPLILIGMVIGIAAYHCYEHGAAKIHTQKSTLFAKLHNHFVPTASAPKPVRNEAVLYARHML